MLVVKVKGIQEILSRFRTIDRSLGPKIERGLVKAGKHLLRAAQKIVPVQMGFLKASGYTRKVAGGGKTADIVVAYTEAYAAIVHEVPGINLQSPVTHGEMFNIKHAQEIAAAGKMVTSRSGKTKFKPTSAAGTTAGGMFPRKPEEQYKFLEKPMKEEKSTILKILQDSIKL